MREFLSVWKFSLLHSFLPAAGLPQFLYFSLSFFSFISKNFFSELPILIWLSKENKEFFHIELDRQGFSASLEAKCMGRLGLTQPRRGDQHDWTGGVAPQRLGTYSTVGVAPADLMTITEGQ